MEKKPAKKKMYKQHAPILIDSSPSDDSENQIELAPKKGKKSLNKIQSINDVKYMGDINKTFTKDLSKDEITSLLDGYKKVEHYELQKGHNIRYFIKDDVTGQMLFRTGGMITLINEEKKYIVVSGGKTFSVQLKPSTIFFQQQPMSEIVRDLKEKFEITESKLNTKIKELEKENAILMKHNKIMNKEIKKLNDQINKKNSKK